MAFVIYWIGMEDHKLRQEMYHNLEPISDLLCDKGYVVIDGTHWQLIEQIHDYFRIPLKELIYPAKSFAVAIIYANLLQKHFKVPFMTSLDDPNLFHGNDMFFKPYSKAKTIYDPIITDLKAKTMRLPAHLPQVQATISFFRKEFYLDSNPYFDNANLS